MQKRLPKFRRDPDALKHREVTETSIEAIDVIARYGIIPRSLIVRLVRANSRTVDAHLQLLFHRSLVNRFTFPRVGSNPSEFTYYLDHSAALNLIADRFSVEEQDDLAQMIRNNREKNYAAATMDADAFGRLMFLSHETVVSRFHGTLELACRASRGAVELVSWQQGSKLYNSIAVSEPRPRRLPHRPDAFFTLRRPSAPENEQVAHFFYECDRQSMSSERMRDKFQAHFQFVVKARKHREVYGIDRVRAILVETVSRDWADQLCKVAADPVVSGPKPSPLFWFTSSEFFLKNVPAPEHSGKNLPLYLVRPDIIFDPIWQSPKSDVIHSLLS